MAIQHLHLSLQASMKKILAYLFWGFFLIGRVSAQQPITGLLIEEGNEEPLEQATIQLFRQKDSTFVTGTTSDLKGRFTINNVQPGRYRLAVSFIGLAHVNKEITMKNAPINLGTITLGVNENTLEEFVVRGVAAQVSVKNDTMEYNAVAFKVTENAVTEDLLKKMPGIEIDSEGKVYVNGEEVKKIRINGKRFFGGNTKMATKNLPADLIDKIQIIEEQSEMAKLTGFEDGETTKMINITIREDKKKGLFANLMGGYGTDDRYEANGIVNWMYGDNMATVLGGANNTNNSRFEGIGEVPVNIPGMRISKNQMTRGITTSEMIGGNAAFILSPNIKLEANYSFGSPSTITKQTSERENFFKSGNNQYYDRDISNNRSGNSHNLGFRLEWKIDSTSTLIVDPDFTYSDFSALNESRYQTLKATEDTVNRGYTYLNTLGSDVQGSASITYSKKLNKKGRTLTFNLRGNFSNSDIDGTNINSKRYFNNGIASKDSIINQQYTDNKSAKGYYIQASYVEPLGKNKRLELRLSQRLNKTDADKLSHRYDSIESSYSPEIDPLFSNIMESTFNNFQANLSFKSYHKKYRYTLGLKAEPSNLMTIFPLKEDVERKVFNISPSGDLTYNFHRKKYLRIDYRENIYQPSATQLQPVDDISNPLYVRKGNPELKPRLVRLLRGTYSAYNSKDFSLLTATLTGSLTSNSIVNRTEYMENGTRITMPVNVNGVYSVYGNVLYNRPLFNRSLTINTYTPFAFNNNVGYSKDDNAKEFYKNNIKTTRLGERLKCMWQNHFIELSAGAEVSYVKSRNEVNERQNTDTYDWEYFGTILFRLPAGITFNTDITAAYKRGYLGGMDTDEIIWNVELEKTLFKNKKGIVSVKGYDLLHQRMSIRRIIGDNYIEDSEYNTIKPYFLFCFAYKLNFWGKK